MKFNNFFEFIISEIKPLRKGAILILLIICLCCAVADYFLRKYGFNYDWFSKIYIICALISVCYLFIKLYNSICDKIEKQKEEERQKQEYTNFIKTKVQLLTPILDTMSEKQKEYLKKFVDKNSTIIFQEIDYGLNDPVLIANYITAKLYPLGYYIQISGNTTHIILEINKELFNILQFYFSAEQKKE